MIIIFSFIKFVAFTFLDFPTLEENPPTVREGKLVFVWQKTFCRTKTQLALFV